MYDYELDRFGNVTIFAVDHTSHPDVYVQGKAADELLADIGDRSTEDDQAQTLLSAHFA